MPNVTKKISRSSVILILILLIGFALRITALQYPFQKNDARRDYVVASHIIKYQEFPLVGPYNAFTDGKNSPLYFYLTASFLAVDNSFMFLSFANVILQMITVCLIYALAKRLFGTQTALLSAFLISLNLFALRQSSYIWQPWVMQPLIILSFLLILISYLKSKYIYLFTGVAIFIFAGAIHNSAYVLSPFVALLIVLILRHHKAKTKHYAGMMICAAISLLASFAPLIVHYFSNTPPAFISFSQIHIDPITQIPLNFFYNISYFISSMLLDQEKITIAAYPLTLITLATLLYYLFFVKNNKEKFYSLLILSSIVFVISLISLIDTQAFKDFFGSHYFTPVFGLLIILFARSLIFTFTKNNIYKMLGIFMLSLYMGFFLHFAYIKFYKIQNTFSIRPAAVPAVEAVKKELINIKNEMGYDNFHFFNIDIYADNNHGWKYSPTVWAILEEDFNTRLVEIDDNEPMGFKPINTNAFYTFLVCPTYPMDKNKQSECLSTFLKKNKNSIYLKRVFSEKAYSIDLITINH
jgi:4-amino-4-deoxy-L-arabinose transferase-like glycosyltransferase